MISIGHQLIDLADEHQMVSEIVLAEVEWLGEIRTRRVIVADSREALLGTEMLRGCRLAIDYVSREVLVEEIA